VVVCDGFVGNVILKTCESISVAIFNGSSTSCRERRCDGRRVPGARMRFKRLKIKVNYEEYGGSPLLGREWHLHHRARLEHAARDQERAARRGESIEHQVNPHIIEEVRRYHETTAPLEPAIR
jgi:glycerol-3-phosphate acyltransferase PlsX